MLDTSALNTTHAACCSPEDAVVCWSASASTALLYVLTSGRKQLQSGCSKRIRLCTGFHLYLFKATCIGQENQTVQKFSSVSAEGDMHLT